VRILNAIAGGIFGWFAAVLLIGRLTHSGDFHETPTCWCKGDPAGHSLTDWRTR